YVGGNGQVGDVALGHRPVDHPDHADDEGEGEPDPDERQLVVLEVDGLAAEQGGLVGEAGRVLLDVDPGARADQGPGALDGEGRVDVPAAHPTAGEGHGKVVDPSLLAVDPGRDCLAVEGALLEHDHRARR